MMTDLQSLSDLQLVMRWAECGTGIAEAFPMLANVCHSYDVLPSRSIESDVVWAGQRYAKALAGLRAVEAEMMRRWGDT